MSEHMYEDYVDRAPIGHANPQVRGLSTDFLNVLTQS